MPAVATQIKKYYSEISALIISPPDLKGRLVQIGDEHRRVDEVIIEFGPMGNSRFGEYETSDQRVIDFLDARIAKVGDVFGEAALKEKLTPMSVKLEDKDRVIEDQNRLIRDLQDQVASQVTGAKTVGDGQQSAKGGKAA